MNHRALAILKKFLKDGYLFREESSTLFSYFREVEIREVLYQMENELDFFLYETNGRVYMIPSVDNEIFIQDAADIKSSLWSDGKNIDLFLNNYIVMFILYLFYRSENNDPKSLEFLLVKDLIQALDERMQGILSRQEEIIGDDKGINFMDIALAWDAKLYGELGSLRKNEKMGCINKACIKLKNEGLIKTYDNEMQIKTTRKLDDLMPYYLSENRVKFINEIFSKERVEDASNIKY